MGGSRHAEPTLSRERIDRDAATLVCHARRLKQRGWRGLVWLNGAPAQARQQALALWQAADWQAPRRAGSRCAGRAGGDGECGRSSGADDALGLG